jgi:dolichol-phosphate mannosyltransferase
MKLLVVIPTYNEIENITRFIPAVMEQIQSSNGNILVVDDGSPDGTGEAVKQMQQKYSDSLFLLERTGKNGLADAYLTGFRWGEERGYDVFLEMDADFSHKPEYIPEMVKQIQEYDVVIGSRNIKGGAVEGWSALRNFISKGGSLYSRMVLHCPVKDLTGGFNMWTRKALDAIDLDKIVSRGYSFQIEMKYRAYKSGMKIKEIPIIFPDRQAGTSKMSKKIFVEAFIKIWKIRY